MQLVLSEFGYGQAGKTCSKGYKGEACGSQDNSLPWGRLAASHILLGSCNEAHTVSNSVQTSLAQGEEHSKVQEEGSYGW